MTKIAFEKSTPLKIILFRTDKLGDVVLSLQCIEAIKATYPNSFVSFALRSYTAPLVENNPFLDEVILIDQYSRIKLIQIIKAKKFDISVSLFASKIACYTAFLARIPIRIGPLSKPRDLLFFTHRMRQERSSGKKNEGQYNLELLSLLGCGDHYFPKIYLTPQEKSLAQDYLSHKYGSKSYKIILLHPGSGGSSKDWNAKNYLSLAQQILKNNLAQVLISGSQNELETYLSMLDDFPLLNKSHFFEKSKPLREFLAIISEARLFLSNGTGPLHCAIALGVPTIGFHTLMRSCKPARWGPLAKDTSIHTVITPHLPSGEPLSECISCTKKCPYYLCMDMISVEEIYQTIVGILKPH
ncbi:hypothetical protein BKH41_05015 [Helicobacter sp. 12S02232-10]|uniref:glycosyltransferase family 9 protein n=1 Tax=Helicobacter sp. 12S02232-10 TaxID=1476197 RepID=UPI000BA79E00|nr:glycosyltransferase family 9 protein [Helicobacter sp. 12S02232-10]PAF48636.1 hypothetical protein BKH41_05015 [Helicobacter sp. 12S02232-10]